MKELFSMRLAVIGLCVGFAPLAVGAQNGQLNALGIEKAPITATVPADRPGFSDNTALVPQGHFEAEGGLFRFDEYDGGGSAYTFGSNALLRTGINDTIELRLGYEGFQFNAPGDDGSGNTVVGAKIRVHNATRYTPTVSILPQLRLPTGDGLLVSNKVEPDLHFIWSKDILENFSVNGNVNFAGREGSDGDYHLQTAFSVAGNYALSNRLATYAEYYSIIRSGPDSNSAVINGGITFLTSRQNQLDAFIGTGLNNTASNVFVGFGIAHLW